VAECFQKGAGGLIQKTDKGTRVESGSRLRANTTSADGRAGPDHGRDQPLSGARGLDILYVGTLPPYPGGSAISCSELLVGLAQQGHTVRTLGPITPEAAAIGDRFAAREPDLVVTRFLVPHFDVAPPVPPPVEYRALESVAIRRGLDRLLAERRPDVVLIGRESFAWDVPAAASQHGIPSVLLIRGGSRTARLLAGEYPPPLAAALLAEFRKATAIVATAHHLTDGLRRLGLAHVRTVSNAVDLARFEPRAKDATLIGSLGIPDGAVVVMHAANLQPRKRSLDVARSAGAALAADPRLFYVIVGEGPLREEMEREAARQGIAHRFRYAGWVDYERMPDYINLADVMTMPSQAEGLARVYLETQACGRLLLASDIPPAREVVSSGRTGLLFELGNLAALTAQTLVASRDPALRATIGRQARKAVQAHALERAVASYAAILAEVARRDRP